MTGHVATNAASSGIQLDRETLKRLSRRNDRPGLVYLAQWALALAATGIGIHPGIQAAETEVGRTSMSGGLRRSRSPRPPRPGVGDALPRATALGGRGGDAVSALPQAAELERSHRGPASGARPRPHPHELGGASGGDQSLARLAHEGGHDPAGAAHDHPLPAIRGVSLPERFNGSPPARLVVGRDFRRQPEKQLFDHGTLNIVLCRRSKRRR